MDFNSFIDIDGPFYKGSGLQSFNDYPISSKEEVVPAPWNPNSRSPLSDVSSDLWPHDSASYRLPESWSQTIDSLLSQSAGHASDPSYSPGDMTTQYASTNSSGSISLAHRNASPPTTQSGLPWQATSLSASLSDPFNINTLPSNVAPQETVSAPARMILETPAELSTQSASPTKPTGSPPIPPSNCISPADLALSRLSLPNSANQHHFTVPPILGLPLASSAPIRSSHVGVIPPPPAPQPSRGLSGWKPIENERRVVVSIGPSVMAATPSPIAGLKPPCPRPSSALSKRRAAQSTPVQVSAPAAPPSPPLPTVSIPLQQQLEQTARRTRARAASSSSKSFPSPIYDDDDAVVASDGSEDDDGDEDYEDDGSDAYQPSSSPPGSVSGNLSDDGSSMALPYTHHLDEYSTFPSSYRSAPSFHNSSVRAGNAKPNGGGMAGGSTVVQRIPVERQARRGKGKAKGSAALALAVVTQMSKMQQEQHHQQAQQLYLPQQQPNGHYNLGHPTFPGSTTTIGGWLPPTTSGNVGGDTEDMYERLRANAVRPGRKRKNSSIPLPVPIPHLIKKSRGRKVPYLPVVTPVPPRPPPQSPLHSFGQPMMDMAEMPSSESCASAAALSQLGGLNAMGGVDPDDLVGGGAVDPELMQGSASGVMRTLTTTRAAAAAALAAPMTMSMRGRKNVGGAYSLAEGGKRAYMCEVPGCGKCFVRGEHLKRHVRSIHTYDKPHPCPYSGCDKSFSRRDNLGQHVRIHLQG